MTWRKENSVSWGEGVGWGWRVEEGYNERLHTPCQVQSVSLQSQVRNLTVPDFQNARRRYSLAVIWKDDPGRHLGFQCLRGNLPHSVFCYSFFVQLLVCLPESPTDRLFSVCLSVHLSYWFNLFVCPCAFLFVDLSSVLWSLSCCLIVCHATSLADWVSVYLSDCLQLRVSIYQIRVYIYLWPAARMPKSMSGRRGN